MRYGSSKLSVLHPDEDLVAGLQAVASGNYFSVLGKERKPFFQQVCGTHEPPDGLLVLKVALRVRIKISEACGALVPLR